VYLTKTQSVTIAGVKMDVHVRLTTVNKTLIVSMKMVFVKKVA